VGLRARRPWDIVEESVMVVWNGIAIWCLDFWIIGMNRLLVRMDFWFVWTSDGLCHFLVRTKRVSPGAAQIS
jgi:hypothetical protein